MKPSDQPSNPKPKEETEVGMIVKALKDMTRASFTKKVRDLRREVKTEEQVYERLKSWPREVVLAEVTRVVTAGLPPTSSVFELVRAAVNMETCQFMMEFRDNLKAEASLLEVSLREILSTWVLQAEKTIEESQNVKSRQDRAKIVDGLLEKVIGKGDFAKQLLQQCD